MRTTKPFFCFLAVALTLFTAAPARAQRDEREWSRAEFGAVPRLMKFADTLKDAASAPRSGPLGLTFAIYAEREGGSPLWMETQNVLLDEAGRFSALLGAATRGGLPADLFAAGEPRWLGVQAQLPDEREQARVLLVSVPYAMKAADAETLGGRPATDYVLREQLTGWSGATNRASAPRPTVQAASGGTQALVSGTLNFVGKFTPTGADIGNSQIFDNGTGVGIGTTVPAGLFDVQLTTSTARDALDTQVTLNNSGAITGSVVSALRMTLIDVSTATNLSKQAMRATYIRDSSATGGVSAFDSVFTLSAFLNGNAPYILRTLNVEGPRVASGRTLSTLIGLYVEAPPALGGTVTNKFALVTEPGAGNVGINTTSPTDALHVVGNIRGSTTARLGSETGATEPPTTDFTGPTGFAYTGMVVRRTISTSNTAGNVIARSNDLTLERDGTDGGFRVVSSAATGTTRDLSCQGITDAGANAGVSLTVSGGATTAVFSNTLNVVYFTCIFGDVFNGRNHTEVSLARRTGDFFWVGSIRSTFNQ